MAEDDDLLAHLDTTATAAATGKKKPIIIIIAIVALLALAGGGYFGYKTYMAKKQAAEQETPEKEQEKGKEGEKAGEVTKKGEKAKEAVKEEPVGVMLPLEPFIVNLAGSEGKRFLKVSITLELSSPGLRTEINENIQKVTDSILILLSSKTFEDVYSIQGKFKLKDEVVTRVNRFLLLGHIKDAYFTEFVIQ